MRSHFDVLSKKAREEWVTVLVDELDENSDIVRVKFRELPESEFANLEASFSWAVNAVAKFSYEMTSLEKQIFTERTTQGKAFAESLAKQKVLVEGYREVRADLQAVRKELVQKTVIDHSPEYFEVDHLPFEGESLAPAAKELLKELGFSEVAIAESFAVGYIQVPFVASSWIYGEGQSAKTLPCASEETVRQYERLRPNSQLLNSLCNAVLYWHRLALKTAALRKEEMRAARLLRNKQKEKVSVLFKAGYIKESRVPELISLPKEQFDLATQLVLECAALMLTKSTEKALENPS